MSLLRRASPESAVNFVPVDKLGRLIQSAVAELEAAGDLARGSYEPPPPRFAGYCARMCQAYKYLALDPRTESFATETARPRYVKKKKGRDEGDSHYWIETPEGVMDLNFGPSETPYASYWPYSDAPRTANSWGFHPWKEDPRYPFTRDSRMIMDRVWAEIPRGHRSSSS